MTPGKGLLTALPILGLIAVPAFAAVENEATNVAPPDMTEGRVPPKEFKLAPPIPEGQLKIAEQHAFLHKTVKGRDGTEIGTIEKIIIDSETGKVAYAEVSLSQSNQMVPVPWGMFNQRNGALHIGATRDQLEEAGSNFPAMSPADFEHKAGEPLKPQLRQGGG